MCASTLVVLHTYINRKLQIAELQRSFMSGCATDEIYDDYIKTTTIATAVAVAAGAATVYSFLSFSFVHFSDEAILFRPRSTTISKHIYEHNPNICLAISFPLSLA